MSSYTYKIGIIGPTRVGKTSLITSILYDMELALASQNLHIVPDEATKTRINDYRNALQGSMDVGEFSVGGMEGTQDTFNFKLEMQAGGLKFNLEFLDFPGAWMDDDYRKNHPHKDVIEAKYNECIDFIEKSTTLLVPLDAALFMESTTGEQHTAARAYHQITEAEHLILRWAKARKESETKGLLIFAPVKCEAYFRDNGGFEDKADKLLMEINKKVKGATEKAIKATENEKKPLLSIKYHPVDTIGGVELLRADWVPLEAHVVRAEGQPEIAFSATYRVRNPPYDQFKPLGPVGIVTDIVAHIIKDDLNSTHSFFEGIGRWWKNTDTRLKKNLELLSELPVSTRVRTLP